MQGDDITNLRFYRPMMNKLVKSTSDVHQSRDNFVLEVDILINMLMMSTSINNYVGNTTFILGYRHL